MLGEPNRMRIKSTFTSLKGIVSAIAHKPGVYKLGKHCVDVGEPDILVLR